MPTLRVNRFHGIAPAFSPRTLAPGFAQVAENIRVRNGDIWPFREEIDLSVEPGDLGNLFWYRFNDETAFISFGRNYVVDGFRTPVPNDVHKRWYFNIAGQGMFAISNPLQPSPAGVGSPVGTGGNYKQFAGYRVGIPAPQGLQAIEDITVLADAGFQSNSGIGIIGISSTNPTTITTDSPHPFEDGQTVRISIDPNLPKPNAPDDGGDGGVPPGTGGTGTASNIGAIWVADGLEGTIRDNDEFTFDIVNFNTIGIGELAPEDVAALRIERFVDVRDKESRSYVFTYVSKFGEEGPPSKPTDIIDVPNEGAVRFSILDGPHQPEINGGEREYVDRIRVYRQVAGDRAAPFLFVGTLNFAGGVSPDQEGFLSWESPPSSPAADTAWSGTIIDSTPSIRLGDVLETENWFPPPEKMGGIGILPNGIVYGWKNNMMHFSEPDLPHAWNPDYDIPLEDEIIGCASYGNTIVAGTNAHPVIISGIDPFSMTPRKVTFHAPLANRRGIVPGGGGVVFPADNGLVLVSEGSQRYVTLDRYEKVQWDKLTETHTIGAYKDGRYIMFAPGETPVVFDIYGQETEVSYLTDMDISAATLADEDLAVIKKWDTGEYRQIARFNESDDIKTGVWESGLITTRKPICPAVGQVFAEGYPVTLKIKRIEPTSYPAGVSGQPDLNVLAVDEYIVKGPEPFRLKAGYMSREFVLEVVTQYRVQEIAVSTSMNEISR